MEVPENDMKRYNIFGADIVIQFPPDRFPDKDGFYRLDYWPPQGAPPPNTTFTPAKVVEGIELTRVLPGTKYDFQLYYCNDTLSHLPRWTASFATGPNAPGRFIMWYRNEMAILALWHRPHPAGIYSHYQDHYPSRTFWRLRAR
ncbi:tyrosine-protein phosphatase 10D-like isoform X4 [Palaemon carinicauda]|uniref:tyrosine-protein phosphatase 10D-like isoform X4 n=1 Tax=Palaemon carinicauda TaxID=392227 RepID=UPI0035B5FFBC